jgi:methyl-accepting chemotaxis protein
MDSVMNLVAEGTSLSVQAAECMKDIQNGSQRVADAVKGISDSVEEQNGYYTGYFPAYRSRGADERRQ